MIQEAYCSFEVARLLKEKGFDELCSKKYDVYKNIVPAGKMIELWQNSEFDVNEECSAPTHQMVMRWLREVHRLHIYPDYIDFLEHGEVWVVKIIDMKTFKEYSLEDTESSFEEAAEEALKYTLKHLI